MTRAPVGRFMGAGRFFIGYHSPPWKQGFSLVPGAGRRFRVIRRGANIAALGCKPWRVLRASG